MHLTHTFDLPVPAGKAFDVFGQLELLAPCFPGATVWGRDGDVYHGAVKIKFGPFPLVFEGTARVVRADLSQRRLVVKANARDRRGMAAGAATVTATFRSTGSGSGVQAAATVVEVVTDLDLTGRPAQLGSGAITSVSDRLKDQFVDCISAKLTVGLGDADVSSTSAGAGRTSTTGRSPAGTRAPISEPTPSDSPTSASPGVDRSGFTYSAPMGTESAPQLQVLPDVLRTWLPWLGGVIGGLTALALAVRWWRRR